MASTDRNEEQLEELRETFEYNDRDGDGSIELDEFKAMLEELESGMSAEEVRFVAWWAQD
jgi:Ca2+-binding EF-hand superfamily protein